MFLHCAKRRLNRSIIAKENGEVYKVVNGDNACQYLEEENKNSGIKKLVGSSLCGCWSEFFNSFLRHQRTRVVEKGTVTQLL